MRREATMWHTSFIVLHATTAVVALFAGGIALRDRAWFGVYYWSLLAMSSSSSSPSRRSGAASTRRPVRCSPPWPG